MGGGKEHKRKRTHEHGQQFGVCGVKWVEVEEGIRGIDGNGKKYNKINV